MMHIVAEHLRRTGVRQWSVLQLKRGSVLTCWIFRSGETEPGLIAKISGSAEGVSMLRREWAALTAIGDGAAELGIPQPVLQAENDAGVVLCVQTGAAGFPLPDELSPGNAAQAQGQFHLIEPWLEKFQRLAQPKSSLALRLETVLTEVRRGLTLTGPEKAVLEAAGSWMSDFENIPAVAVHGDFWAGNVLRNPKGISVVDWADFHYGAATEDVYNFAVGFAYRYRGKPAECAASIWSALFGNSALPRIAESAALRALGRWKLQPEYLKSTFVLFLITRLLLTGFTNHAAWRAFAVQYVEAGMPAPFSQKP